LQGVDYSAPPEQVQYMLYCWSVDPIFRNITMICRENFRYYCQEAEYVGGVNEEDVVGEDNEDDVLGGDTKEDVSGRGS
jgi:hypothetical protein